MESQISRYDEQYYWQVGWIPPVTFTDVGSATNYTASNLLAGETYYFATYSYVVDGNGQVTNVSDFGNEVAVYWPITNRIISWPTQHTNVFLLCTTNLPGNWVLVGQYTSNAIVSSVDAPEKFFAAVDENGSLIPNLVISPQQ